MFMKHRFSDHQLIVDENGQWDVKSVTNFEAVSDVSRFAGTDKCNERIDFSQVWTFQFQSPIGVLTVFPNRLLLSPGDHHLVVKNIGGGTVWIPRFDTGIDCGRYSMLSNGEIVRLNGQKVTFQLTLQPSQSKQLTINVRTSANRTGRCGGILAVAIPYEEAFNVAAESGIDECGYLRKTAVIFMDSGELNVLQEDVKYGGC